MQAIVTAEGVDEIVTSSVQHDIWAVVTQDCDLDRLQETDNRPRVELRPLFVGGQGQPGIRSRLHQFSRNREEYLDAESLRPMVSANSLRVTMLQDPNAREGWLDEEDLAALKTWLGRRYNRPAVPEEFVELLRQIAAALEGCDEAVTNRIRKVFATVEAADPPRYDIVALINGDGDPNEIEAAIADALLDVPQDLGVLAGLEAHRSDGITLEVMESSFEVDASYITWGEGAPHGAV